jgi:hypothetical protein
MFNPRKILIECLKFLLDPLNILIHLVIGFSFFVSDYAVFAILLNFQLIRIIFWTYYRILENENNNRIENQFFNRYFEGNSEIISIDEFKLDDLITVSTGDVVPFDCLIIENYNLFVNDMINFNKFAESKKQIKEVVYAGTEVISGNATLQIIAVGNDRKFIFNNEDSLSFENVKNSIRINTSTRSVANIIIAISIILFYFVFNNNYFNKNYYDFLVFCLSTLLLFIASFQWGLTLKEHIIYNKALAKQDLKLINTSKLSKPIFNNPLIDLSSFINFDDINLVKLEILNPTVNSFFNKVPKHYLINSFEKQIFDSSYNGLVNTFNSGQFIEYKPYSLESKLSYYEFENGTLILGDPKEVASKLRIDEFNKLEILGTISLEEVNGLLAISVGWLDKNTYARAFWPLISST